MLRQFWRLGKVLMRGRNVQTQRLQSQRSCQDVVLSQNGVFRQINNRNILRPLTGWSCATGPQPAARTKMVTLYGSPNGLREIGIQAFSDEADLASESAIRIPEYCSGCGVKLQNSEVHQPGYFTVPKGFLEGPSFEEEGSSQMAEDDQENEFEEPADFGEVTSMESSGKDDHSDAPDTLTDNPAENSEDTDISSIGSWKADAATQDAIRKLDMLFEEPEKQQFPEEDLEEDEPRILCARCYSLQHYGLWYNRYFVHGGQVVSSICRKVKSQKAEALMPGFDLGKKVGRKMALQKFRRPVILCVVDMADFDGSLPRAALMSLLPESMKERGKAGPRYRGPEDRSWNAERVGGLEECRFIVAANKADLLPVAASSDTVQMWIRRRLRQAGLPKPDSVHMISSVKQQGIKNLLSELQRSAGMVGDVWVVGAQNAGKSTLINAMRRAVGKRSRTKDVTTAPLPGTTLGTLRVDGVMQGRCRMFDTPGVPHDHQISSLLTPDEVRMVLPRNQIKPRSFRISAGQSIHLGGLARVDVVTASSATLYLTAWISNDIALHYGKTVKAEDKFESMAGTALVPPIGSERLEELGPMVPFNISVEGDDWKRSCQDIAIAGLGWVAVGTGGTAHIKIWTFPNVAITKHEPLLPQFAPIMEKPGLGNRSLKPIRAAKRKLQKDQQQIAA